MGVSAIRAPRAGRVRSLPELLRRRVDAQPDNRAYTFLDDGEREGSMLSWSDLLLAAEAIAARIAPHIQSDVPRSRVLILCPPGLEFVPAFFGTLAAGAIAVPSYPPRAPRGAKGDRDRTLDRVQAIARDARPDVVIGPRIIVDRADAIVVAIPELSKATWIAIEECNEISGDSPVDITPDDVAFLQYTSGSTAEPRGVMVTHGNLLHNLADAHRLAGHSQASASVSWLPVIHDMGLIQGVLQAAFSGFPAWLMAPAAFLQRPARWLQAIGRTGATISGGPNFAYDLCSLRIGPEERAELDLRSWRLAFNGAEPIRTATLETFAETFAPCGFDRRAFRPSYGLAEATLLVTTGRGVTTSCGDPAPATQVRIVDPTTCRECAPGTPGEIWIDGPGVAAGYWNQPNASRATFGARIAQTGEGPFLRSGDLGTLERDGLHVTGRIKDILIVRGVKHFPQDLEQTVERASPMLRLGCCAVFALPGVEGDLIGVAAEIDAPRERLSADCGALVSTIREAIGTAHGLHISAVALVAPGTIPKTTSGKLQRYACREGLLGGSLPVVWLWTDIAALAVAS
jgi:acyl-CoA synthetase (AMP-forming)/AMP-acid ligase II